MSDQGDLRAAAQAFIAAAFEVLRRDSVIPTPSFHPFVAVGRDYFGPGLMGLAEYKALEDHLNKAYPTRFEEPLKRRHAEFASTYMFSLLEAAVARCSRQRTFLPDSPGVTQTIEEMVRVLDEGRYEVICCRVVSHFTTESGQRVDVGPITVVPEDNGVRSFERIIPKEIPAAPSAFNRDPPFTYDPPHSLLIAKEVAEDEEPYAVAERLSGSIERFLLHLRLLTAGTVQSCYEVRGTATLVSRMSPLLITFQKGTLDTPVRRTVRVNGSEAAGVTAIGKLIDEADVKREGMVATSLDVALGRFLGSYHSGTPFEHLVDLATALEATLAGGEKDNEGLTLRLRNRAAALLATDDDPAQAIFSDVGLLYGIRSKLVHGGQIKQKELRKTIQRISTVPTDETPLALRAAFGHAIDRMRDIVRRALLARLCLAAPPAPLWSLAATEPVDALLADDSIRIAWRDRWHERMSKLGVAAAVKRPRVAANFLSPEDR